MVLIIGVTGKDGIHLAELLRAKGHEVHGIKRRASSFNTSHIDHLYTDPHVENRQYGRHYVSVIPSNLYGPNDNYALATS